MSIDTNAILALPAAEKLQLVELIWDDLGQATEKIPLPAWVVEEGLRRRDELRGNPSIALSHEEVWKRIHERKG